MREQADRFKTFISPKNIKSNYWKKEKAWAQGDQAHPLRLGLGTPPGPKEGLSAHPAPELGCSTQAHKVLDKV